jgi:hypothetical protein
MDFLPLDCMVLSNSISIPYPSNNNMDFNETAKGTIAFGETMLRWSIPNITNVCENCEDEGRLCGFTSETRQAFCKSKNQSKFLNHSCNNELISNSSLYVMILLIAILC